MLTWVFFYINLYFDLIMAVSLAVLLGFTVAVIAVRLKILGLNFVLGRILFYGLAACLSMLIAIMCVAAKTDPDFPVGERYANAWRSIKYYLFKEDPLLSPGGLITALQGHTDWASKHPTVYYTVQNRLYSIFLNGQSNQLRFSADADITQAAFSPDGKALAVKTRQRLFVLDLTDDEAKKVYELPSPDSFSSDVRLSMGGIQWSPDSRKICFFVEKGSRSSSQTQWFVYDRTVAESRFVPLGARQSLFLVWAMDSERLYFHYAYAVQRSRVGLYRIRWYEVPLETLKPKIVADFASKSLTVPDKDLEPLGIRLFRGNRGLRLESPKPFRSTGRAVSKDGRRIYINHEGQLCYVSSYGVRYALFGLSTFSDYLMFPPKNRENDFLIEDVRWVPSKRYILLRHYVQGLLVLDPVARRVGILVGEKVGVFGVYRR